jgi:hypothetical protein
LVTVLLPLEADDNDHLLHACEEVAARLERGMKRSIVLLFYLLAWSMGGCANRNEVSYEVPAQNAVPHTAASNTGVDPNPGASARAVGTGFNPGH